jgi:hypothetical protein
MPVITVISKEIIDLIELFLHDSDRLCGDKADPYGMTNKRKAG